MKEKRTEKRDWSEAIRHICEAVIIITFFALIGFCAYIGKV